MNRKIILPLLGAEAAVCLSLALSGQFSGGGLAAMFSFPFAPLGQLLRRLSLSGAMGNIVAVALYVLLSLIPAAILLLRLRRGLRPEDALLGLMSLELFLALYLAVNPGLMAVWLGEAAGGAMGSAILGGVFYSMLAAWLVLRALRACLAADAVRLGRYGSILLAALAAACVFAAAALCPVELLAAIRSVRQANQGNEHLLGPTYCFLALRWLIYTGAYLLDLWVIFGADRLLSAWAQDAYSDQTVAAASALSKRCAYALAVTVLANMAFQLLQLPFMSRLHSTNFQLTLPLSSLALVIAALLLAQYIREGKRLKDDNDLFI